MIVHNSNATSPMWYNGFMDAINVLSFMIGMENFELNVTSQDLSAESNRILEELRTHFATEDEHLTLQDQHLIEQDRRLDRLEKLVLGIMTMRGRKDEN